MKSEALLFVIVMIILIGSPASALYKTKSFDKVGSQYGKITIKDNFGITNFAEYSLDFNTNQCLIDCYAEGRVTLYDKAKLFDNVQFRDKKGDYNSLSYTVYLLNQTVENVEIPDYGTCPNPQFPINSSEKTIACVTGSHKETVNKSSWEAYIGKTLDAGTYSWKIAGRKSASSSIDWIAEAQGFDLTDWAWWNSTWEVKRIIEVNNTLSTSRYNYTVIMNLTKSFDMNADFSDIRFINSSNTGEMNYSLFYNATDLTAYVFFPNLTAGNSSIFMYFGNPTAASKSDIHSVSSIYDNFDDEVFKSPLWNKSLEAGGTISVVSSKMKLELTPGGGNLLLDTNLSSGQLASNFSGYLEFNVTARTINGGGTSNFQVKNDTDILEMVDITDTLTVGNWRAYINGTNLFLYKNNALFVTKYIGNNAYQIRFIHNFGGPCYMTIDDVRYINSNPPKVNFTEFSNEYLIPIKFNSYSYNLTTYETMREGYVVNFTFNDTPYTLGSATLKYDASSLPATVTGTGGNRIAAVNRDIGLTPVNLTKDFYWEVGVSNATGTFYKNSTIKIQAVNPTIFIQCNDTVNVSYINFQFKDENTLSFMNSSIDSGVWNHYLGTGAISKAAYLSNITQNNPNVSYCFFPSYLPIHTIATVGYSLTGYPQRTYYFSGTLTNTTTNKILYLLASTDGIYATYVVVSGQGSYLSDVTATVSRDFSGIPTTIMQDQTGADGAVTFWMNPNYDHTVVFTKSGCTPYTLVHRPTSTSYTVAISCAGEAGTGVQPTYVSPIEGIIWRKAPASGILSRGIYNFSYYVNSTKSNLANALMQIVFPNGTIYANSTACVSGYGCYLTLTLNVTPGATIKGEYYIDIGNGYIPLELDARWREIQTNASSFSAVKGAIQLLLAFFNEWGLESNCSITYSTEGTCNTDENCKWVNQTISGEVRGICIPSDRVNKLEYSRFVWFFLVFAILLAVLGKATGYDAMNPGYFLTFLTVVIVIGSIANGLTGQGFFYLDGLTKIVFINNFIIAATMIVFTIGMWAAVMRRSG